jgi:hypothetical protein
MTTIYIADDAISPALHSRMAGHARGSLFQIGWVDTSEIHHSQHKFLHSTWSHEFLRSTEFLTGIRDEKLIELIGGREPTHCMLNLSVPCDVYFSHTHPGQDVLLYYVNLSWCEEWAGETLFFADNRRDILFASSFTPNRVILFDGEIPHSIRPQSVTAPHYRFTLSVFFDKRKLT